MRRGQSGQATVEAVALVPLLVIVAAAGFHVLAAGAASDAAGAAAEAGAVSALQGRDAASGTRDALRGWPRRNVTVRITRGRVQVTVRPRVPIRWLARRLEASAVADAGPLAAPAARGEPVRGGDGLGARP